MNSQPLRTIWGYRWWLLVFAIAAGAGGYFLSGTRHDAYQSTASVQMVSGQQATGQYVDPNALLQFTNVYADLAQTKVVSQGAAALIESGTPTIAPSPTTSPSAATTTTTTAVTAGPSALATRIRDAVTVSQESDVEVLDFVAEARDPRTAQRYAAAYSTAFVQYVDDYQAQQRGAALQRIGSRVAAIEAQLRQLPAPVPGDPEDPTRTGLGVELSALQSQAAAEQGRQRDSARVIQAADLPTSPSSPKPLRDGVLAGLAALVLAALLAYARSLATDRYESGDELSRDLELPLLAEVPPLRRRPEELLEAFRSLRTNVSFAMRDRPSTVLLVTSARPGAGKTFVTANLGTSLAMDNKRVLAVDADLRHPSLDRELGVPSSPGLANLLHGWLAELPVSTKPVGPPSAGAHLDVMPSGSLSHAPAELYSTSKFADIIANLRTRYDVVIFDSPPVGEVVDAAIIAGRGTDGVIFVVDARSTRRRDARRAAQTLRAVEIPLLGVVFNRSSDRATRYGPYTRSLRSGGPRAAEATR